ncbi:predicted protein [Lichtheimia corymbifera JMRC:FSU:9682]|uniref:F-box domain-containing protein n=1 Tax=Lichtheimia corymbifera JMRC:FSU:9682 TaxID=1263082 RepID=A0A068RYF3_9FUNG|nr:predicted protein [Lichtheimia corymbifera JMRC:FSU:9682]
MTIEENIAWSELLKHTNLTAQCGNDGNRIATATESLQQAAHQFTRILNERARLLANSAQFDAALRDAAAIRTILPGSGLGYLCTGDVYRQQGRYAAAISIYDQGLEAVPESDPYYQQLQQHRTAAIANNNKRVDLISRLPLDIVITNIIPRVEPKCYSESSCEYLYVSRTWQQRFLQQPNGLEFDFGKETGTFKTGHDQLVRFAPYIQSLSGGMVGDARLDDLSSRAHFSNLKDLHIHCDSNIRHYPTLHGLQLISDSLTHLTIAGSQAFELRDILESCPNLVSLNAERVEAVMSSPVSSRYPKITHLALHDVSEGALSRDNILDVLSRFPSLLSLKIAPIRDASILPVLHEYCPYLQFLYYGDGFHPSKTIDVSPNRKGIKLAHLGYNWGNESVMQGDVVQFLHLNRDSLEAIAFGCSLDEGNFDWDLENGIPETSFMRLASIDFSEYMPPISSVFIAWLISNAPNLNFIGLHKPYLRPNVANAMINSRHLSKLKIVDGFASEEDTNEAMFRFFEHHSGMGEKSTLQEVTIETDQLMLETALISRLQCLKKLELIARSVHSSSLPGLEMISQGCPALEELTLGWRTDPYEFGLGIIPLFSQHSNLKCLKIGPSCTPDLSDLVMMATYPSLECLYLHCDVPTSIMTILPINHTNSSGSGCRLPFLHPDRHTIRRMAIVENIRWDELLKDTIVTAQCGNDGNRIATATESLQQVAYQFAQVLNERAQLLANSAQFDTALRDAAAIRTILPGSGLGYLCMGDVHCQQRRYAAAISIYDQGLQAVTESDQYYQQLQQHRLTAININNKRVDYISRLPLDIVITNILPRLHQVLSSDFLCEYLYVSRAWQERFLHQPNGLEFDFGQEEYSFHRGHDQLVRFAPYVQKLRGNVFDDAKLEDLFSRARFSNLKNFRICCDATIEPLSLLNGLQRISDSLTHLEIQGVMNNLQLRDILEPCPNLVSLITESVDPIMLSAPSSRYPKITHLALHDILEEGEEPPSHDDVIDLLSRFPSLLAFQISPTPRPSVYHLGDIDIVPPRRKGIKSAHIGGDRGYVITQGSLIEFLHVHKASLEEVKVHDRIDDDSSWRLRNGQVQANGRNAYPTSQLENSFTQLLSIDFSNSDSDSSHEFVLWLILNAPNLKAASLRTSHLRLNIVVAMNKSRHLSKLEIMRYRWGDNNNYLEGLLELLNHHMTMGNKSTHKELTIRTYDNAGN